MIAMPLPCKITKNKTSDVNVTHSSFGSIVADVKSVNPNSIDEVFTFTWQNLSYADVHTIEDAFMSSKGTQRFTYELERYHLEDSYTITVSNNRPQVEARFRRVQ